jgi:hypothetical protein
MTFIGTQYLGGSIDVPIAEQIKASLASGVAAGTSTGGNGILWPPSTPGTGK